MGQSKVKLQEINSLLTSVFFLDRKHKYIHKGSVFLLSNLQTPHARFHCSVNFGPQ